MATYSYSTILTKAKNIKNSVEKNKKLGEGTKWSYYFAKEIIKPKTNVTKITFEAAPKPSGHSINDKVYKADYIKIAKHLISFVEKNKRLPNFITWKKKNIRTRDYVYMLARIVVYYNAHKELPNYATVNTGVWTTKKASTSTNSNCKNPYTSSPHHLNQGAGYLGQTTPYTCGPHSLMQGFKKFGWDLSESKLAQVAGTTTSGTSHSGLETAIAWVAKQKGVKLTVEWKNFSDFGKSDAERYKAVGQIACKPNKFVLWHIGYEDSGEAKGSETFGHYEMPDKYNISTKYLRIMNSLGSRQGNGYYGHLQDRSFSLQSYYVSNISQKSICIVTKG